jgi:SprB repeat
MNHTSRFLTLLCTIVLYSINSLSAQQTWYVNQNATGQQTGQTWTDAFTDLHEALGRAKSGDQVWVASGTYRPGNKREDFFELKSGVRLYGGFKGDESKPEERNIADHPVYLDGDIGTPSDSTDNSYTLLYMAYPEAGTLVNGIVFQYAQAWGDTTKNRYGPHLNGGAVYVWAGDSTAYPDFEHCTFRHNTAWNAGGAVAVMDSFIYKRTGGLPYFRHCVFEDNRAGSGGAVFAFGGRKKHKGIDYYDCRFERNTAFSGGALCYYGPGIANDRLEIIKCSSHWGRAGSGGFLSWIDNGKEGDIVVDSCEFSNMSAYESGAAVIEVDNSTKSNGYYRIRNSHIHDNEAYNESGWVLTLDALITIYGGFDSLIVNNNLIENNNSSSLVWIVTPNKTCIFEKNIVRNNVFDYERARHLFPFISHTAVIGFNIIRYNIFENNNYPLFKLFEIGKDTTLIHHNLFLKNKIEVIKNYEGKFLDFSVIGTSRFNKGSKNLIFNNIFLDNQIWADKSPEPLQRREQILSFNNIYQNNINAFDSSLCLPYAVYYDSLILNTDLLDPAFDLAKFPINIAAGNNIKGGPDFEDAANYNYRLLPCSPGAANGSAFPLSNMTEKKDFAGTTYSPGVRPDIGAFITPQPVLSARPKAKAVCRDDSTGSVSFDMKNICPPVFFEWNNGNTFGVDTTKLSAGTYTFTISDQKGRQLIEQISIPRSDPQLAITGLPYSCPLQPSGILEAKVAGGIEPIDYQWNGGQNSDKISNLPAGIYTVSATDAIGCSATATSEVKSVALPVVEEKITKATSVTSKDGAISLQVVSGGLPPFTYLWDNGATTSTINNLKSGSYTVVITDAAQCGYALTYKVDVVSSTTDIDESEVQVFPNPARSHIFVRTPGIAKIMLTNQLSRLRHEAVIGPGADNRIEVNFFERGVYHYRIMIGQGFEMIKSGMIVLY